MAFDTGCINPVTGKRVISFKAPRSYSPNLKEMPVPCGKCSACLARKRNNWINRMLCEMFACGSSTFLTLTYDNIHCPSALNKKHLQDFFKRLRNVGRDFGIPVPLIRYFACGEYGKRRHRPHYHAIVFGVDMLRDSNWMPYVCGVSNGHLRFSSSVLEKVWPFGFVVVGDCSLQSVRYVSKYITKQYELKDKFVVPPFTIKSIGLGRSLFVDVKRKGRKYEYKLLQPFLDLYSSGRIVLPSSNGYQPVPLPSCLDSYAERFAPSLFESVKAARREFSSSFIDLIRPSVRADYVNYKLRMELMKGELDNE